MFSIFLMGCAVLDKLGAYSLAPRLPWLEECVRFRMKELREGDKYKHDISYSSKVRA